MLSPLVNVEAIFLLGRLLHGSRIILINYLLYHTHPSAVSGPITTMFLEKSRIAILAAHAERSGQSAGSGMGMPQADQTRKPEHKKEGERNEKRAPPTNRVAIASNIMGNIFAFPRLGMDH